MKGTLIDYCKSIGIEYVGIAPAEPYLDFEKAWGRQLQLGHTSGFEEKDVARRVYPSLTLEDAKSVIVCLFPYHAGGPEDANLTKSAFSKDYHIIVKGMLEKIAGFLADRIRGFNYRAFADNGPFSDRYLAYRAGLGFWGVNNHIITDRYGSYVFIGYILNNHPFEADQPRDRTCQRCLRCVRECPGQCIKGDFTINPQRCKSFITQKKGGLSEEDRRILMKSPLIWGCDVCQDVCPHNAGIDRTNLTEFLENLKFRVEYDELTQISNREFAKRYGDRSFSWRGKGVLTRNHEIIHSSK